MDTPGTFQVRLNMKMKIQQALLGILDDCYTPALANFSFGLPRSRQNCSASAKALSLKWAKLSPAGLLLSAFILLHEIKNTFFWDTNQDFLL